MAKKMSKKMAISTMVNAYLAKVANLVGWMLTVHRNGLANKNAMTNSAEGFSHAEIMALADELAALPRWSSPPIKASQASRQGEQSSRFMGSGFEYAESRAYQPGDEIRRINWRLMARTGRAFTKLFQETRQENWLILVDHRATMRFGTRVRTKAQQAVRVAGYFAWQAQQAGIPVAGVRVADTLQWSPTVEGRSTYLPLMALFAQACSPQSEASAIASAAPRLNDVLLELNAHLPQGARVVLISDFMDVNEATTAILAQLQQHLDVQAIWIEDAAELELPPLDGLQLHAMGLNGAINSAANPSFNTMFNNTPNTPLSTTLNSAQRQSYQAWLNQYHQRVTQQLQAAGIALSRLRADESIDVLPQRLTTQVRGG